MKKSKGFTLIELLAVIVILAIIALIATPIIVGVINDAKKNAFTDTAYGVAEAAKLYYAGQFDNDAFTGKTFDFTGNTDELKLSGKKPSSGTLQIDKNGNSFLAISDGTYCAVKNSGQSQINVFKGKCSTKLLKDEIEKDTAHIVKNTVVNGEKVNKVKGTKAEKLTMKNYVWYSGQLWQVLETNDTNHTIKLITAQSLTSIAYGETYDWQSSWVRKWLNEGVFYPALETNGLLVNSTFCLDEPTVTGNSVTADNGPIFQISSHTKINTCTKKVSDKVGLMTFEDYAYANTGTSATYTGGSYLDEDEYTWIMTPYTVGGKNNQMFIQWYTNGYLTFKVNAGDWSITNTYGHGVRPVISITDTAMIAEGTGTKKEPYILTGERMLDTDNNVNGAKVGDYVYLDESKNPYTFTEETIARDLKYTTTKDKVRYRIVAKEADGMTKIERADILRNLPNTIAIGSSIYVPYYYSSTCGYIDTVWQTSGCTNHNMFLPDDGSGEYNYTESKNVVYYLNNASNSFYNWYSDITKNMIQKSNWNLYTSGQGKDYSLLNNNPSADYPARTTDGVASANVGLPSFGEMYSGNDLNYNYWLLNRWSGSSFGVTYIFGNGEAVGGNAGSFWLALRPVVRLKSDVKVVSGEGTMTKPYTLKI